MQITLLGTGSALPSKERLQTGIFLKSKRGKLLVDCGSGILHRLKQAEINFLNIDKILLTHTHLDHISDISSLAKARFLKGNKKLSIMGPPGTVDTMKTLFKIDNLNERLNIKIREIRSEQIMINNFRSC